jgi:hypothetical protein
MRNYCPFAVTLKHSPNMGSHPSILLLPQIREVGGHRVSGHSKPYVHIASQGGFFEDPALRLQRFVKQHGIRHLNVAGSRESKDPGIYLWMMQMLEDAFFWSESHPGMLGGPGEG